MMTRLGKAFCTVTAISLTLSGCGVVQTYRHPGSITSTDILEKDGEGFTYFLPRRRVKITGSATKLPDDIRQKIAQAQSKAADTKKARNDTKAEVDKEKALLAKMKGGAMHKQSEEQKKLWLWLKLNSSLPKRLLRERLLLLVYLSNKFPFRI